jgi:hypothetical protein
MGMSIYFLYSLISVSQRQILKAEVSEIKVSEISLPKIGYKSDLYIIDKLNKDKQVSALSLTQELQGIVEDKDYKSNKESEKEVEIKETSQVLEIITGINNNSNDLSKRTVKNSYQFIDKDKIISNITFKKFGVVYYNNVKMTYYSDKVLPGGGLNIPGKHYEDNFVVDKDGFIVVASNIKIPKGTIYNTPFGRLAKVYDRCEACNINWIDIYVH